MKILISGCSFTYWRPTPNLSNISWAKKLTELSPNIKVTNLAEKAAGNQYIANSIIQYILSGQPVDQVLVMWSGVSRFDFLTSTNDPNWQKILNNYGFFRSFYDQKLAYIFSGGISGAWHAKKRFSLFDQLYKVSEKNNLAYINLMEILRLQDFLQCRNIPYRFMSYVNYWNDKEKLSPNGDFGVYGIPEVTSIIDAIDFEPWIFSNSYRDGLYELALSNNDFLEDGFHPGSVTQKQWAEIVTTNLKL